MIRCHIVILTMAVFMANCATTGAGNHPIVPSAGNDLETFISDAAERGDSFEVMRGLIKKLGYPYAGLQKDGTVIECVTGIRSKSLATTTAGNRAIAVLASVGKSDSVIQYLSDYASGEVILTLKQGRVQGARQKPVWMVMPDGTKVICVRANVQ